jgi:RNA polymerase sigma factor (sigma-70 family)
MTDRTWLADQFETFRPRLQSVAYNMLGSVSEAQDAVQECWLRLDRSDSDAINNLGTWLTTVVGRICLDVLRTRKSQREDYVGMWLPEPLIQEPGEAGPEHQAELADTLGLALLVVLETLSPAERLAFVLHDIFGLSFEDIGEITDRSATAARQLASRARRRVRTAPRPDADVAAQRQVVDAFLVAARSGDFDALLSILAPDSVLRVDIGPDVVQGPIVGAAEVAHRILATAPRFISLARPILVNGSAGLMFEPEGRPALAVLGFTVVSGRIEALDLIIDAAKLSATDFGTSYAAS